MSTSTHLVLRMWASSYK